MTTTTGPRARPLLSVLIPTRNRCEYLRYAIQSAVQVNSNDLEILVSENWSTDASRSVCETFTDPRLTIMRPSRPLPMHENFEYLLRKSRGEWVTFVGDDDAIMPHCIEHLAYLTTKYPRAEAIWSPRAHYFWDGCQELYGPTVVDFSIVGTEVWRDSKKMLKMVMNGHLDYIELPQMYSGGLHRRSLINRVFRSQNDVYFRSVSPDAYSALMACIHTYRYLETGVPLVWVGSSPHKGLAAGGSSHKDRNADFFDLLDDDTLSYHGALGDLPDATFTLYFYEAFVSAFPMTTYDELSSKKVRSLFIDSVIKMKRAGKTAALERLARDLGFEFPQSPSFMDMVTLHHQIGFIARRAEGRIRRWWESVLARKRRHSREFRRVYTSCSHQDHPDILSCDALLADAYQAWKAECERTPSA